MSLLIIVCTLFVIAFFKITLRRFSYALYQATLTFDALQDEYYSNIKIYGNKTQTKRLENLAKKHSFQYKKQGQIIQVINGKATIID
ncbi:MAG: hypothetical protein OXC37_03730 [Bdellovibrionaceae bacterium]|nr:hypothetical protein [Pseudobdellovibrionaceae bacterium]